MAGQKLLTGFRLDLEEPFLLDMAIHHFDLVRFVLGAEPVRVTMASSNPSWSQFERPEWDGVLTELAAAIRDRREPAASGRDNLRTLALTFAAIASARSGEPVEVGAELGVG